MSHADAILAILEREERRKPVITNPFVRELHDAMRRAHETELRSAAAIEASEELVGMGVAK